MKVLFGAMAALVAAQLAFAQAINPVVTWDVSIDNGLTWSRNVSLAVGSASSVKVRGSLSWSNASSLDTAFCLVSFDGSITGVLNESVATQQLPFQSPGASYAAFVNLGNGSMRFSEYTDSGLAGSNSNFWAVSQQPDLVDNGIHSFPNIDRSNAAHFLYFDLDIDYSASHSMTVSSVFNNTRSGRAARVYRQGVDGGFSSQTQFSPGDIALENALIQVVVPSPSALVPLGLCSILSFQRRRSA